MMSPRARISREQWLADMSALLAEGLVPADMPLSELCQRMGVTKGSFYSHFPGGLEELHREIIGRWQRESDTGDLAATMLAVRDPRDRLRLLRARALQTAQRDGAMRRWGARDPAAAATVARRDADLAGYAAGALQDLGLPQEEAALVARVLVDAFAGAHHASAAPAQPNPAQFEMLLDILTRAATAQARPAPAAVDVAPGSAPDEVVLFTIAQGLPAEARRDLRDQAQRFAEQAAARAPGGRRRARGEPGRASHSTGA